MAMTLEEEADIKNRITTLEKDLNMLIRNFILTQKSLVKLILIIQKWSNKP